MWVGGTQNKHNCISHAQCDEKQNNIKLLKLKSDHHYSSLGAGGTRDFLVDLYPRRFWPKG